MRGDLFIPLDMPISREWDLNPRPTVYKTVALPLSYFGTLWQAGKTVALLHPVRANHGN